MSSGRRASSVSSTSSGKRSSSVSSTSSTRAVFSWRDLDLQPKGVESRGSKYDLVFSVNDWRGNPRRLTFEYRDEEVAREKVGRMCGVTVLYENGVPIDITSVGWSTSERQLYSYWRLYVNN